MKHQESDFLGLDQKSIYYQAWLPEEEARAVLIIVHGFGEHSGRYKNVVNALESENIAIYGLDHRGHGKSEGKQNHVNRFSDYLQDLTTFEEIVKSKHPKTPLFLLGHSMGSLIATHFMAEHPDQKRYSSLILSGTGSDFGPGISKVTIYLAKILSFIAPKLSLPSNLDPNFISHDEKEVESYKADPLVNYEKITARLGGEMMGRTKKMPQAATNISIPTLIQIGSEDEAFSAESRQPLADAINNEDKKLIIYDGCRHEVYNEVKKEVVLDDLKSWINKFLD